MNSILSKAGYTFDEERGIWLRPDFTGIAYSDGDEIEQQIASIVKEAGDVTSLSNELEQKSVDWTTSYHLSRTRSNILRPHKSLLAGDILEIGAGCGAITRFLGECGGRVLALEGSPRRASIARNRTRDLTNVTVIAEQFDRFEARHTFDVVTLIGVLEYANLFIPGEDPTQEMLRRAKSFLKPGGLLIIAIENQLGLKYFAGAPEDHISIPMYGIEGQYSATQPQTFGRRELTAALEVVGFTHVEFAAAFPDYKFPSSIVTERAFLDPDFDVSAFAWQTVKKDAQYPATSVFSAERVWPIVIRNGLGMDLANSFLIVARNAVKSDRPDQLERPLAYHYATGRERGFCKATEFIKKDNNEIEVFYSMLEPAEADFVESSLLRMTVPKRASYVNGRLLSQDLISVVTRSEWRFGQIRGFFIEYINFVLREAKLQENYSVGPDFLVSGKFYDLLPQNIIVDKSGNYHSIDEEWECKESISLGFIVFRAMVNTLGSISRLGRALDDFNPTPVGFISSVFSSLDWDISEDTVRDYAALDARIQSGINGKGNMFEEMWSWLIKAPLNFHNVHTSHAESNEAVQKLLKEVDGFERQIDDLSATLQDLSADNVRLDNEKARLEAVVRGYEQSISWKVTAPARFVMRQSRRGMRLVKLLPTVVKRSGGLSSLSRKALRVMRYEGVAGLRHRLRVLENIRRLGVAPAAAMNEPDVSVSFQIVPHYVDPNLDSKIPQVCHTNKVAVHVHLFYIDMLDEIGDRLNNIRAPFDIFVSIVDPSCADAVRSHLNEAVEQVENIYVEVVPNRGRDLAPLIVQFGERLSNYNFIGHFHSKKSSHNVNLCSWSTEIFDNLLGPVGSSGGRIQHFFDLLSDRAKIIYSEPSNRFIKDASGWADNFHIAEGIVKKHTTIQIHDYPNVEFPEGSMFWARSSALRELLKLPLNFNDFPAEPIPENGTLAHAIERLILLFADKHEGQCFRIHQRDSLGDYRNFEPRRDFRACIVHNDIKVLAYYLPQFHPTPLNDEWHGKGFTEWTKVRAANPLFRGHYQQHIPHDDLGYYILDTPEVLRKQAAIMQSSGVHGLVFYHYWFDGQMILDEPARMLLNHRDIAIPFCFCWANENWTRRWDGNESEVLLAQKYSDEDAAAFIRYLIPFFKDGRYITLDDGRPVLLVYRPSSIPDPKRYVEIWRSECAAQGVPAPYVVAVLTRGATSPQPFGMDAGTERVLHDWTGGGVNEINSALSFYEPVHGSVLDYNDVADFYSAQNHKLDFTYFRSIVPMWDNTARYAADAYVVHGSTPQKFQEWLHSLINYSKVNLAPDRRFIFVNAWNEWAEGAHLEPDTLHGYAYLNAVGRALSDIPYGEDVAHTIQGKGRRLHLHFTSFFLSQLSKDVDLERRFFRALCRSTVFTKFDVTVNCGSVTRYIGNVDVLPDATGVPVIEFRRPAMFGDKCLEEVLGVSESHPESTVIPNFYASDSPIIEVSAGGSVDSAWLHFAPFVLYSRAFRSKGITNVRLAPAAFCVVTEPNSSNVKDLPKVTTVVRVHEGVDLEILGNALLCLAAMKNCACTPLVAAQDLSVESAALLDRLLSDFEHIALCKPHLIHYRSTPQQRDLRAKMLNQSLQCVDTQYAGFLDYDDLLQPHAYEWLIGRLRKTGKAVAFGRVYATNFSSRSGVLLERTRAYEYGYDYEEFLTLNHAPLHSFLLDLSRLDLSGLVYHEDQRYMEDYYMTLQLFTRDNADWEGLRLNRYIGDYLHSIDRPHTLAFVNDRERSKVLSSPHYKLCEERVHQMRSKLGRKG